eukprot:m.15743 g.15743  ORF g.15743 m.15743 type:complete len:830 (-) comp3308_c0_seq1:246-2735(-)
MAAAAPAPSIEHIFKTLEYGPAPESPSVANAWLDQHDRNFGHFINGKWVRPDDRKVYDTMSPATGEKLASTVQGTDEDVNLAVDSAKKAFATWGKTPGHVRARHLYSIARHVQKHARLIAVIEALDNGKPIRETRDADVQVVARHLYHYAGWAQLMETEMRDWQPCGVVGGIVAWNFPLMLLVWKIAPALAAGNTVVMKPATYTRLSALLFAEICNEAGLPPGVFNVVTGSGRLGSALAGHPDVDKVGFTGSTEIGQLLRRLTAGSGKKISLELGGKSPVIVFDSADLDAAVEGVVDAIFFNQGLVCSAGSRLLIQENIYERFIRKLKERMTHLRVGSSLDKGIDMGAIVDQSQLKTIEKYVQTARDEGNDVYQECATIPQEGLFYPPTLITNVQTTSTVVQEEIFGPVIAAMPFRTAKEALALANQTRFGLAASVWTENMALALECALTIKAGTVWVNAHNLFDAASGFGGYRESGFGRDGGKEGLYEYVKPSWMPRVRIDTAGADNAAFGKDLPSTPVNPDREAPQAYVPTGALPLPSFTPTVDRTYKLYIGGKQARPDATYVRTIKDPKGKVLGQVSEGNRKDIRNAVEAAHAAQKGWGKRAAHNRAQIVYYLAENIEVRRDEFVSKICAMTGCSPEQGAKEVDASVMRLFHWAAYADKYGGTVQETTLYGATVKINEPVGPIGIACPEEYPLLGFVSLFAPAIVRGNTLVIIPSEKHPLAALDLYQVFETSDVPAGVINVVSGSKDVLMKTLAEHQDVEACWYFGTAAGAKFVETKAADNCKRTWVDYGVPRDWYDPVQGQGEEFLIQSTEPKNIWLPMGEIFAN